MKLVKAVQAFNYGRDTIRVKVGDHFALEDYLADQWVEGGLAIEVKKVEPPPVRGADGQVVTWKAPKKQKTEGKDKPAAAAAPEDADAPEAAEQPEAEDVPVAEEPTPEGK